MDQQDSMIVLPILSSFIRTYNLVLIVTPVNLAKSGHQVVHIMVYKERSRHQSNFLSIALIQQNSSVLC